MLTAGERSQIRQLLSSPAWNTAQKLAEDLCDKIREQSAIRDSEWDSLKALLTKEGEERGIRRFIQELFNAAQEK